MTNIAIENGPVEIVEFPMKNGGSFHSYVSSPEGKPHDFGNLNVVRQALRDHVAGLQQLLLVVGGPCWLPGAIYPLVN